VAEIAPAKWTMFSKAVPNTNTQNGIPPKKRMLFRDENYKKTEKRKLLNGQFHEKSRRCQTQERQQQRLRIK
jgi:hypothetical protein